MQETTNLAERLKKQAQEQNETIQSQTHEQLKNLRIELNSILHQELHTIRNDIQSQSAHLGWIALKSRIMWPTIVGLTLSAALFAGSWGMMLYFTHQVTTLQNTLSQLEQQEQQMQNSIKNLKQVRRELPITYCGEEKKACVQIDLYAPAYGENRQYRILKGY